MSAKTLECKMCHARYKLPEGTSAQRIPCKRCGNTIFVSGHKSQGRHKTSGIAMSGTPTRRRSGQAVTLIAVGLAVAAIAGALYWLS